MGSLRTNRAARACSLPARSPSPAASSVTSPRASCSTRRHGRVGTFGASRSSSSSRLLQGQVEPGHLRGQLAGPQHRDQALGRPGTTTADAGSSGSPHPGPRPGSPPCRHRRRGGPRHLVGTLPNRALGAALFDSSWPRRSPGEWPRSANVTVFSGVVDGGGVLHNWGPEPAQATLPPRPSRMRSPAPSTRPATTARPSCLVGVGPVRGGHP